MTILENLGTFIADAPVAPTTEARLRLHLLDTVGAYIAGTALPEAAELRGLLEPIARDVGITRATEVDDIHPPSCTTPGAIVVPVALHLAASLRAAGKPVEPADLAAALQAGYGVMTWMGGAVAGPALLYRGIWPTYLLAPLGAAAVGARLMRLDAGACADALAIAMCRISGGAGAHGGGHAGPSPRWLLAGEAARAGAVAASAAAVGFAGDRSLLDGDWLTRVHGIVPGDMSAEMPPDGAVGALSMKPFCAAKQTQAALDGFRQIMQEIAVERGPSAGSSAAIETVTVAVPPAYSAMIGHRRVDSRTDRLTNVAYLLAIAALVPDELHEIARRRDGRDPAIAEFTARTEVVADSDLDRFYPRLWPAQVTVRLADRSIIHRLVTAAEGDPGRSLDEAAVLAKFRRLTTPSLPLETADRLAASSLAATRDGDAMATLLRDYRNLSQY